MIIADYPHNEINLEDKSIGTVVSIDTYPTYRPFYVIKARKGKVNEMVWCESYDVCKGIFGEETFDSLNDTYYSAGSFYLKQHLKNCGAFVMRVADETAVTASMVLECSVTTGDIVQYTKDANGFRTVDVNGNFIPVEPAATKPGVTIKWAIRPLATDEVKTTITPVTNGDTITYPIYVFEGSSQGLYGNDTGFSLYFDLSANEVADVTRVGSIFMSFQPIRKNYNSSVTNPIRDKYNGTSISFAVKPGVVDPATEQALSMKAVVENNYDTGYELPYSIIEYSTNIQTICNQTRLLEDSTELILKDDWKMNIFTGKTLENKYYDTIAYDDTSIALTSSAIHYLQGGTDGSTTEATIEALQKKVYDLDANPALADEMRYPFSHIIDTGVSLDLKKSMLGMLAKRNNIKVIVGTHINALGANDNAADESMATVLSNYALLMRESTVKGTACCRGLVFMQAGIPTTEYSDWVPATYWYALKKSEYQNKTYLDKATKGRPNAEVTCFKEVNWTPSSEDIKKRSWGAGANYFQYASMTTLFYPSIRTVYPETSSVLLDDEFTDMVIYCKRELDISWSIFAGKDDPTELLHEQMRTKVLERTGAVNNNKYVLTCKIYQTDKEKVLGYVHHVKFGIQGSPASRVWLTDMECTREGYTG